MVRGKYYSDGVYNFEVRIPSTMGQGSKFNIGLSTRVRIEMRNTGR